MSKIVSMSSGAIDPIAVTKRVFWRPSAVASPEVALKVGDPVCYKLDAVDHKERTVDPVHLGLTRDTYAEGEQEMTGRLFSVEEPDVYNCGNFAGIVKSLGSLAGEDGDMVEIFKANSGAVVPANVVLASTTAGRSILAVMAGTRTLGSPTVDTPDYVTYSDGDDDTATPDWDAGLIDSKVVGIAMETLGAAGLCWVKLDENMFQYQGGQMDQEYVVEAVADDVTINKMNVEFNVTAGHCQMLHYRAVLAGTGGDANKGVYRFETFTKGVPADSKLIFGVATYLEIGGAWGPTGGHLSPLKISIRTKNVNPDLSLLGNLSAIHIDWILRKDTTNPLENPPQKSCIMYVNSDTTGTEPDFFILSESYGAIAIGTDAKTSATCARTMKINANSIDLYIPVYTLAELTT